jgi:ABC-type branched-subunit amino acid transport system permease subunit
MHILIRVISIVEGAFATSAIASVTIAVIGGAVLGSIAGAITGAIERDQLEDAIRKLEEEINSFGPLSEKYTETIYTVLAEVRLAEIK